MMHIRKLASRAGAPGAETGEIGRAGGGGAQPGSTGDEARTPCAGGMDIAASAPSEGAAVPSADALSFLEDMILEMQQLALRAGARGVSRCLQEAYLEAREAGRVAQAGAGGASDGSTSSDIRNVFDWPE